MCGIAGVVHKSNYRTELSTLSSMIKSIEHRGPDDFGMWQDETVSLLHCRLSIIDLTDAGKQPMISSCQRFALVYNGEIYNAMELKNELSSHGSTFRGHSDTEVVLEAVSRWGTTKTLDKIVGMFAFALWDRSRSELSLVRDRIGIKPLYYAVTDSVFLFASELKALREHPHCPTDINRLAVKDFLNLGAIPAPKTIYNRVYKLLPGQLLTLSHKKKPVRKQYWSFQNAVQYSQNNQFKGNDADASFHLEKLICNSVKQQMISDVPIGGLLSGGIDSSLVCAIMQANNTDKINTFTIGFDEHGFNEAKHAKRVAQYLGTNHTEMYLNPTDILSLIPNISDSYDEPFGSPSQIPTYLLSKLARQQVSVALSGDGGDELFRGYAHYFLVPKLKKYIFWQSHIVRTIEAKILRRIPRTFLNNIGDQLRFFQISQGGLGNKVHRFADSITLDPAELHNFFLAHWLNPNDVLLAPSSNPYVSAPDTVVDFLNDDVDKMQFIDSVNYLPDNILTKVDRASMAVSLEVRVPLLDHRIVQFAWSLPGHMKARNGASKWILRQLLYKYIPREIVDRPKMGFAMPLELWLKGELKEWAEDLLSHEKIRQFGILDPDPIRRKWKEHQNGLNNGQAQIWNILMFQCWCERWLP